MIHIMGIKFFNCEGLNLRIDKSRFPNGLLKEDKIEIQGQTRTITFVYSSDGGSNGTFMYFRPESYFTTEDRAELNKNDSVAACALLRIDLTK
jgi:hypothetical protein